MNWEPISDLPSDWQNLMSQELPPLVTVWQEQAERLRQSEQYETFMVRLRREIAIETGILERLYTIDRGVTQMLIEQGIDEALIPHGSTDKPAKKIVALIRDQETAVDGLFQFVNDHRASSNSYIKQLHQLLTRHQPTTEALNPHSGAIMEVSLRRGEWKLHPNNPTRADGSVYEYAPPEQVASEMDKLIAWHHQHEQEGVPPEVEAAWLHHRFTQIHPFQDGNGRVARCLASLVLIKARWFPLMITRDDRVVYIDALEKADTGNLAPLVALFAERQKRSFIRVLSLSEQIMAESRRTDAVLNAIVDKFKQRPARDGKANIKKAEAFAQLLFDIAQTRLDEIEKELKLSLMNLVDNVEIFTVSAPAHDERFYYYRYQVIETANTLDYYANLNAYHSWLRLAINIERPTMILISFHGLGTEYHGLLACSASAYHRDQNEDNSSSINEIQSLTNDVFQFSYADQEENLVQRYKHWLENAIMAGLTYWNRSL